jgi:hypothetical protein
MRPFIAALFLVFFGAEQQMVAPKVEHKKHETTQTYDEVIRSCPAGYEGHFVDINAGFDYSSFWSSSGYFTYPESGGQLAYAVCFDKKFMDEIRKNPELLAQRPAPPKPV